ncbi:hypothetical protein [Virgibacillus sp. Bac330]|uniref:hypothetical protein n=1 Tax=Virgibacillus sp. Bac330 TaxID=2419841 RepID=UPI000EF50788|nr:hypothetical protein [Virgibacillus sp. Bac330]
MENKIYIEDNFFSSGKTSIKNSRNERIGDLDLKTAFSTSITVYDIHNRELAAGKFKHFFSSNWLVSSSGEIQGTLKANWFSFAKKYTYTTHNRGHQYTITSPVLSKSFTIMDERYQDVATFTRVNSFFSSPAYELTNLTDQLSTEEFIVVVMGINAMEKNRTAATSS